MKNNRYAVSLFFFINGFLYANWTSRLPEIQENYGISHSALGTLLFSAALGAVLAMPLTGWFTTQFGTRKITAFTSLMTIFFVPILIYFNHFVLVTILFFIYGCGVGAWDVAMNGQAVFVERLYKRPIMSSFHAIFSIGMASGAGVGALFARAEIAVIQHLIWIVIPCATLAVFSYFFLIDDKPVKKVESAESEAHFRLPTKAILPLGIIAFCCMTGEGSMADWSALYMTEIVQQTEFWGAMAIGTFAGAMTLGRLFGDYFTARLGKLKLMTYNSLLAISGICIALFFPTTWMSLLGFFLIGLGLSTIVPIVYSTAGNTKGVEPSVGIAMATTVGYAGFFVGPPTIGFLADAFSLRVGLGFILVLFVVMFFLIQRFTSEVTIQHI